MPIQRHTLKKEERLKSRKIIQLLFSRGGQSFSSFPLRIMWTSLSSPDASPLIQIAISVPRRSFPSAVKRNRIKRQIRETFRLNKSWLYSKPEDSGKGYAIMFLYVAKEPLPYKDIEKAMRYAFRRLLRSVKAAANDQEG